MSDREPAAAMRTVLLVEDDDATRGAFSILLEDSGYRVAAAATGADALRLAASAAPDVVVLDLGLPDTSGLEVARALRASPGTARVPILALSGHVLPADREAARGAGCTEHLGKPVPPRELLRVIAEVAGR